MMKPEPKEKLCSQHKKGVSPTTKRIYTPWCPMCRQARAAGKFTLGEIAEGLVEDGRRRHRGNQPPFRRQRKPSENQKRLFKGDS